MIVNSPMYSMISIYHKNLNVGLFRWESLQSNKKRTILLINSENFLWYDWHDLAVNSLREGDDENLEEKTCDVAEKNDFHGHMQLKTGTIESKKILFEQITYMVCRKIVDGCPLPSEYPHNHQIMNIVSISRWFENQFKPRNGIIFFDYIWIAVQRLLDFLFLFDRIICFALFDYLKTISALFCLWKKSEHSQE